MIKVNDTRPELDNPSVGLEPTKKRLRKNLQSRDQIGDFRCIGDQTGSGN